MARSEFEGDPEPAAPEHPAGTEHRLWGGRFSVPPAPALEDLNRSLPIDQRLWREDIQGSRAWVQALARAGVIADAEARALDAGLARVAARLPDAARDARDEDIHTLVERLLYEEVGDVAGKLHTGRSRNDQVATDSRLWALHAGQHLQGELRALAAALADQAAATIDLLVPAYTHLRRAQPVRLAHWLLAHFWPLMRDAERLDQALVRTATLPLGSGAIAGCAFPVDRELLRDLLGFRAFTENSIDAVGDRDWVAELLFVAALVGAHLSRLAEDLIVFSSEEFGFVRLPEAYTTGSSLMPQKRNPDGLELARGKAARLVGDVAAALSLLKGLPSGYDKDLQEDKELLFPAFDTLLLVLPATRETIAGLRFDEAALARAVDDDGLLATDLADELVRRGVPFREAHGAVGRLLRRAEAEGARLEALADEAWAEAHPAFLRGGRPVPSPIASVEARGVPGGTARAAVEAQLSAARAALAAPSLRD
jgi:argininosuccinate lyase